MPRVEPVPEPDEASIAIVREPRCMYSFVDPEELVNAIFAVNESVVELLEGTIELREHWLLAGLAPLFHTVRVSFASETVVPSKYIQHE